MASADGATANGKTLADQENEWREKITKEQRPADKPFGRCLVDFLTQQTASGLRPLEKTLLDQCAKGEDVNASKADKTHKKALEAKQAPPANVMDATAIAEREATFKTAVDEFRAGNISDTSVRAEFLRFLVLGGDAFAPVHEAGIQLWNARIDGDLELRSCKCVSRVALTNCVLAGHIWMQDARLDVLLLSHSTVMGFHANRAKISGAMWLDENFYAEGEVELFGIEIGGRLDCSSGYFAAGIEAPGAVIGGDLNLSRITGKARVSFINADIGGSLIGSGAVMEASGKNASALDFSRAKVKGDVILNGASIKAAGGDEEVGRKAIDAQNITIGGSVKFGGGFVGEGEVCLNGATISKALDFAGGKFQNRLAYAIRAERSQVTGAIKFETNEPETDWFEAIGSVSLSSAQCGELNCNGGRFDNPPPADNRPWRAALDCNIINVAGLVSMCNSGTRKFHASGQVSFFTSRIGQHMYCGGGWFENPGYGRVAMQCQAIQVGGCVFLSTAYDRENVPENDLPDFAFQADGKVDFTGATIGLQMNCQSGRFNNMFVDSENGACAAAALDLSSARVGDTLFLGSQDFASQPPAIRGSIDFTGATVRVLVDDGLIGNKSKGLQATIDGMDANGVAKTLQCTLKLDQFSYERLVGRDACNAENRKNWLRRQWQEDLGSKFKPQPFEQLITVMRAMGYDDEADDIALFKRQTKRQTTPLIDIREVDWPFPSQAAGVVAAAWLAIFAHKTILPFIMLFWLFRKLLAKLGEILLLDWFVGYGYNMARAVFLLLLLIFVFGDIYAIAFQQGAIVPADKDVRNAPVAKDFVEPAPKCKVWSVAKCPEIADEAIPLFNPWLYSADVMVPVVTFGQKAAWAPTPDVAIKLPVIGQLGAPSNFVYDVQLVETVLGWVEGFLLVSFVTGLIAKE